jgi:hypothetical protein
MSHPPSSFRVQCPCCQAVLSVDPGTGAVLSHEAAAPAGGKADMDKALQSLKEGKNRREDLFNQSFSAEKNKGDLLKKKFAEAVRQAKEKPDAPTPPREIDL